MKSALWTDKEKESAIAMCKEGLTAQAISEELRRSRNSIIGFLHRSGLSLGKAKRIYKKVTSGFWNNFSQIFDCNFIVNVHSFLEFYDHRVFLR
jgi:hypothetical protein